MAANSGAAWSGRARAEKRTLDGTPQNCVEPAFLALRQPIRHIRRRWGPNAYVYHICAPLYQAVAAQSREELLGSKTFLGFLLRQALPR
jgi:hypothetical protein